MKPIVLREKCWVPADYLDIAHVEAGFTHQLFEEARCTQCEYRSERPCDVCESCPGYGGTYVLYAEKCVGQTEYIGLPLGARKEIRKLIRLKDYPKVDKRSVARMKTKGIEFTGTLLDYQRTAVDELKRIGYGLLEAPPRSGKTVMGIALAIELGYKTLILANQYDFLEQFYETLCGSSSQIPLTNIPDIEKFNGKRIAGIASRFEDYFKYDIVLSTYQTFISEAGQHRYDKIKSLFGTVIVDEIHRGNATHFSRVINNLYAKHRFGLTATPERKDKKDFIIENIVGPVVHTCKVQRLVPTVQFVRTKFKREYKTWVYALRGLEQDKERNALILKHIAHDLAAGHSIVIPVTFTSHAKFLVDAINKQAGKRIATTFTGQMTKAARRQVVLDARKGKVRVVVGMRQLVQLGINVPKWSCIYEIMPISNPPNFLQESSRILTPYDDKPTPLIKFFIDNMGISKGCLRTCIFKTCTPNGFKISPKQWARAAPYLSRKRASSHESSNDDSVTRTKYTARTHHLLDSKGKAVKSF